MGCGASGPSGALCSVTNNPGAEGGEDTPTSTWKQAWGTHVHTTVSLFISFLSVSLCFSCVTAISRHSRRVVRRTASFVFLLRLGLATGVVVSISIDPLVVFRSLKSIAGFADM